LSLFGKEKVMTLTIRKMVVLGLIGSILLPGNILFVANWHASWSLRRALVYVFSVGLLSMLLAVSGVGSLAECPDVLSPRVRRAVCKMRMPRRSMVRRSDRRGVIMEGKDVYVSCTGVRHPTF